MGKSSPPPPDYGPLAEASKEAAEIAAKLGREQLDFAKRQYADMRPLAERIANSQVAAQDQQMAMATELYDRRKTLFDPVENRFVQQAMDYNTEAERERLARQAAADAGLAFSTTQQASERAMASMGVNPNSGRFQGQQRATSLGLAAQRANAMTGARERAELTGRALLADAAGLNRGLTGLSQSSTAMALNAGTSALGNAQAPGQAYLGNMNNAAGTILQGTGQQISGLGNILNAQTSIYQADQQANGAFWGGVGNLVGSGIGAWAGLGGLGKTP